MSYSHMFPTRVISAVPGFGQYEGHYLHPTEIVCLDSAKYKYITDKYGFRSINPEYPHNYVKQIIAASNSGAYPRIFISHDKSVRKALADKGLQYSVLTTKKDDEAVFKRVFENVNHYAETYKIDLEVNYALEDVLDEMREDRNAVKVIECTAELYPDIVLRVVMR